MAGIRARRAAGAEEKSCGPTEAAEYGCGDRGTAKHPGGRSCFLPQPDREAAAPMRHSSYFSASYRQARSRFLEASRAIGASTREIINPATGPAGETLATDLLRIGPANAERVLLTISATHGVEGYCGSGVQTGWLESGLWREVPAGIAQVIVHAINPYGFAWDRRVTEDNVDLNRNFVDFAEPLPVNQGYE